MYHEAHTKRRQDEVATGICQLYERCRVQMGRIDEQQVHNLVLGSAAAHWLSSADCCQLPTAVVLLKHDKQEE